ncbi:collagenase 3-like [Oculina patagonica]
MKYLTDYNYISQTRAGNHDMTTAIKRFQKFFGLPVTGRLDEETLYEMRKPRCGVPDVGFNGERIRAKRYKTNRGPKWSKTNLKYYLSYGEDLSHSKQDRIFAEAFKMWSDVAPKLRISRTYSVSDAELKISFGKGSHAGVSGEGRCNSKFDGKGNVLAHAFYPEDGRLHFDDDEKFSETGSAFWGKQSLIHVAVHEIGHALVMSDSLTQT